MSAAFLEIDNVSHRYFVNGVEQISVTQVLERAGLISCFSQRDEQARWRGDSVHRLTAKLDLEGKLDLRSVPIELRNYVRAWVCFKEEYGIKSFLKVEERVDSREHGYSGRLDRLCVCSVWELTRPVFIIDLKTGPIPSWAPIQLSAYGLANNPKHGYGRIALQLKRDGRYVVKQYPRSSYLDDCREFLQLLNKVKKENQDGSRITE